MVVQESLPYGMEFSGCMFRSDLGYIICLFLTLK